MVAVLVTALVPGAVEPSVQAHRGGPLVDGRPAYAEATLPAFRAAAQRDEPVELDLQTTADGVLVVLHDATLDRTTTCTGPVAAVTAQQLAPVAGQRGVRARAHAAGLRVIPWTLDDAAAVRDAGRAGVDTVMTDDPVMAERVLARQVIARMADAN